MMAASTLEVNMTNCWLEIDTGAGDFAKIEGGSFGSISTGQQLLLTLLGSPNLLTDMNGQQAGKASNEAKNAMDSLRGSINTIATPKQALEFEPLLKFLDSIHDAGLRNPNCIFRCVAGTPV
jgi:hypothetical protein